MSDRDYHPIQDPNYGEINIWGINSEIDALPWNKKRAYLKSRFANDGLLVTIYMGKFFLGDDADIAYKALKNDELCDLCYQESAYGSVLRVSLRGNPTGKLQRLGFKVYQYFAGGWDHANSIEDMDVCDFIRSLDGEYVQEHISLVVSDEPLMQMSMFDLWEVS